MKGSFILAVFLSMQQAAYCISIVVGIKSMIVQHPGYTAKAIFSSMGLSARNVHFLMSWLNNDYGNVMDIYTSICKRLTREKFEFIIDNSDTFNQVYRDRLLSPECIDKLTFRHEAINYLLSKRISFNLPHCSHSWDGATWKRYLQYATPEHADRWCKVLPRLFINDQFLRGINLPKLMTRSCLVTLYKKRDFLLQRLRNSLGTASVKSLGRLQATAHSVSGRSLRGLRTAIKLNSCSLKRTFFTLARLGGCGRRVRRVRRGKASKSSSIKKLLLRLSEDDTILAFRMLTGRFGAKSTLDRVKSLKIAPVRWYMQLVSFFEEVIVYDLSQRRRLFAKLGVDYDSFSLCLPSECWAGFEENFARMPLSWRLSFYRRHFMYPSVQEKGKEEVNDHVDIIPNFYIAGTRSRIRHSLVQLLVDGKFTQANTSLARMKPKVTKENKKLFDHVLDHLIYAMVRFNVVMVHFSGSKCSVAFFQNDSPLSTAFREAYERWSLNNLMYSMQFCQIFMKPGRHKGR